MTLIVQLRLRNTHNFVGARSSCSIGVPRTDSISVSLKPIKRSTPCVPASACFSSPLLLSLLLDSSGGAAAGFRAGGGACAGSCTPAAAGPVTSSGMLVRNSAGGELLAQPTVSSTAAKPSPCRMRGQFIPVSANAIAPSWSRPQRCGDRPCALKPHCKVLALDRPPRLTPSFGPASRQSLAVTAL